LALLTWHPDFGHRSNRRSFASLRMTELECGAIVDPTLANRGPGSGTHFGGWCKRNRRCLRFGRDDNVDGEQAQVSFARMAHTAVGCAVSQQLQGVMNISSTDSNWGESKALWLRKLLRQQLREERFLSVI